jgi:hypothetical protein
MSLDRCAQSVSDQRHSVPEWAISRTWRQGCRPGGCAGWHNAAWPGHTTPPGVFVPFHRLAARLSRPESALPASVAPLNQRPRGRPRADADRHATMVA